MKSLGLAVVMLWMALGLCFTSFAGSDNKSKATAYETEQHKGLVDTWNKLVETPPGPSGNVGIWVDMSVGSPKEVSYFGVFDYLLGGGIEPLEFYSSVAKPGKMKIVYNYFEQKDALDRHRLAKESIRQGLEGKEATLETVKELYAGVINDITYSRDRSMTDVYDLLYNRSSTCNGISQYLNQCCKELNIESYFITGYTSGGEYHAWNACVIDGETYTFDATFALEHKGTDKIWDYFKQDSTMLLEEGRSIEVIY